MGCIAEYSYDWKGEKIPATGCYRDAVRSTAKHVVTYFGLKRSKDVRSPHISLLIPYACAAVVIVLDMVGKGGIVKRAGRARKVPLSCAAGWRTVAVCRHVASRDQWQNVLEAMTCPGEYKQTGPGKS